MPAGTTKEHRQKVEQAEALTSVALNLAEDMQVALARLENLQMRLDYMRHGGDAAAPWPEVVAWAQGSAPQSGPENDLRPDRRRHMMSTPDTDVETETETETDVEAIGIEIEIDTSLFPGKEVRVAEPEPEYKREKRGGCGCERPHWVRVYPDGREEFDGWA